MIHSIVFERQPNVAAVLQQILATARGLAPTETTSDWSYARRRIAALDSPVVVLGPDAEDADLQSALTIMGELPATSFVLVADELDAPTLQRAMRSGIRDVVSVEMAEIDLPAAVVRAHASAAKSRR